MNTEHKVLYLVRHAKSSWSDSSLSDRDRPLNKRGRRNAPDMGRRMAEQGHKPELIISSPANRAYSTACRIAREIAYEQADIVTDDRLYFASMRKLLEGLDDQYQKVMIVGHNPAMTSLLNDLAGISVFNMPTCAIAVLGFDINYWADLHKVEGELLGYDYPKGPGTFKA